MAFKDDYEISKQFFRSALDYVQHEGSVILRKEDEYKFNCMLGAMVRKYAQEIRTRYDNEFEQEWRAFCGLDDDFYMTTNQHAYTDIEMAAER